MGLVRDWERQTARAASVSLIAPLFLLGAATLAAVTGGGLGGLGSLAQIASGPSVPLTDLEVTPRSRTLGRAQAVALRLDGAGRTGPSGSAPGSSGETATPGSATPGPPDGTSDGREIALSPGEPRTGPAPNVPSSEPPSQPSQPQPAPPPPPASPIAVTPPANPVDEVVNTTRDLGESLPAPLGPSVGNTTEGVLGPRR